VLLRDPRCGPSQPYHGIEGKKGQCPPIGKEVEGRWEIVREDVGGVGATASFIVPRCNNQGDKEARLYKHGKKAQLKESYASSNSSYDMPYTSWDTTTISKTDPTIAVGSAKAEGLKAKPTDSGQSCPKQPERETE
jgi:hypothetical protein